MSFGEMMDGYTKLRLRLASLVGPDALSAINLPPPRDAGSELAFLRLVAWSYALFHENGKVAVKFLLRLGNRSLPQVVDDVQVLRTWAAHNLNLERESDERKLRQAWAWMRQSCGVTTPDEQHWSACFGALSTAVAAVIRDCISAAELLDDPLDGPRNVEELKRRVDREWDGYRFDPYVEAAAERFGFRGLEPVELRKSKLDAWRKVLRSASADELDALLTRRIESDVLELMGGALPLAASEVLDRVAMASSSALAVCMMALRRRGPMSAAEFVDVLNELGAAMDMMPSSAEPSAIGGQ